MADAVTVTKVMDGPRHCIFRFTNNSDGTGESAVTKVDISADVGGMGHNDTAASLSVEWIQYSVQGFEAVELYWDATADDMLAILAGEGFMDFSEFGGIHDPRSSGTTGDIKLTTVGTPAATDSYDITIKFRKKV